MSTVQQLGKKAEDRAANFLLELGYSIIARRYKGRYGEIDLIALDNEIVVCIEVKYRAKEIPELAIDSKKIRRIKQTAVEYIYKSELKGKQFRFDVIAMDKSEIRHYIDAFR